MGEPAKAQPQLERVNSRIQAGEAGVRNMHEADLCAPVVLASQEVQAERAARREVYMGSAGRHVIIREKRAATEFEIGNDLSRLREIPFQREGIQTESVGSSSALNHQEDRHDIHRIFELSAQKARSMRRSQNPAVTRADIPHAAARRAAIQSVATTSPELQIMPALLRPGLCPRGWGTQQRQEKNACE